MFEIKNVVNLRKTCCFFFENEAVYACTTVWKYVTLQMWIYLVEHFSIVSPRFREKETVQCFINAFFTKTKLSQGLLPNMDVLEKMFPTITDMKNEVQNIFFKIVLKMCISVPVKRRRRFTYYKVISGTVQRTFEIFVFTYSFLTSKVLRGNKCSNPNTFKQRPWTLF